MNLTALTVMARVIWLLNEPLCHNVLMGYDLNSSLQLTAKGWSILDIGFVRRLVNFKSKGSEKIHANASIENKEKISKRFTKFAKCKDLSELNNEACRIEAEINELTLDLSSIKNLILVLSSGNVLDSSSESRRSGSPRDNSITSSSAPEPRLQPAENAVVMVSLDEVKDLENNAFEEKEVYK